VMDPTNGHTAQRGKGPTLSDSIDSELLALTSTLCAEIGACCLPGDTCLESQFEMECTDAGGIWQGGGITCDATQCPPSGACCNPLTGVCTIEFPEDCDALGNDYQGDDTVCKPNPCDLAGACCTGDNCDLFTEEYCALIGGCYRGDGTICDSISSGGVNEPLVYDFAGVTSTITVPNLGTVEDVRVFVNIDQQSLERVNIFLEHCDIFVELYDGECGPSADDMRARFRDGGEAIESGCSDTGIGLDSPPAFAPPSELLAFDGLPIAGEWTLHVFLDSTPGGGGVPAGELNRWRLSFPTLDERECIDCNMNGTEDSCETQPLYNPLDAAPEDVCINSSLSSNAITSGVTYTGDTTGANSDAFIWCGPFFSLFDQYWIYTPRSDGQAFVSVNDFGPEVFMVSVHSNCPDVEDNVIACSANNTQGVFFDVNAGEGVLIRVAGLNQDRGAYALTVFGPPALLNSADDNGDGVPDACECRADINGDGVVDATDFMQAMNEQGNCVLFQPDCPSDVNLDGEVNELDLAIIINEWGPCPFPQMMLNPAFQPRSFKGEAFGDELVESGKRRK
ncbi:MAG: hypothetical protein AAF432_12165, partial [Planctomycetota bacterium]